MLNIIVPAGYRGSSEIVRYENVDKAIKYYIYESPRGSLGISECAIVVIDKNITQFKLEFKASGRRVGIKHGVIIVEKTAENRWKMSKFGIEEFQDLSELDV